MFADDGVTPNKESGMIPEVVSKNPGKMMIAGMVLHSRSRHTVSGVLGQETFEPHRPRNGPVTPFELVLVGVFCSQPFGAAVVAFRFYWS